MSRAQIKAELWEIQQGTCPICGEQIERHPIEYRRDGQPKASQDRLAGVWAMRVNPEQSKWDICNLILVHAPCGNGFSNWLYSKPGREWMESAQRASELFDTGGYGAIGADGTIIHARA